MQILLAEDECVTRESTRLSLESNGHSVTAVDDGFKAFEALQAAAFDIVLMDIKLPGMDGIEVTRRIRGIGGALSRVPVIAMTAFSRSDLPDLNASGFTALLEKPYSQHDLLRTLQEHTS